MPHPDPRFYHLICDNITDGVFTVDSDWRILTFNTAAERMTGMSRDEAKGKRCSDVFRTEICAKSCALRRTLQTGEPIQDARVTILNQDMQEVPVSVSTTALRGDDGEIVGGIEIMRDLSAIWSLRRRLEEREVFQGMAGSSPVMLRIFEMLPSVARSDVPVLIQGPSGTGKELVARAVHRLSRRSRGPFVQLNCGALPDNLLESELFGHRRGAFTDARRDSPGRFQTAHGGTLLLDEIGDTSPAFQVKLLRALQEGEIHALGATHPTKVDVRIISATNKDLAALVRQGLFREDLYYRLRVIGLEIPPLVERREDIAVLLLHLLDRVSGQQGKEGLVLASATMALLLRHDYPGNVRELENILQRAVALCQGSTIEPEHLPPELNQRVGAPSPAPSSTSAREEATLRPATRRILRSADAHTTPTDLSPEGRQLLEALRSHEWNRERSAKALGIGRTTLWRRMKEHGLLD